VLLVYFGLSPFVSALLVGAVAVVIGLVIGLIPCVPGVRRSSSRLSRCY